MSTVVKIATGTHVYDAIFDATWQRVAFVTGSVVDEVTGAPIENASVRADRVGVLARVVSGGYFAASGLLEQVFPDHATLAWSITLTFTAPRYRPRTLTVPIPAAALFPVNGGVVNLRPLPVRVEGRVTKEADHAAGISGAKVAVKSGTAALLLRTTAHADHAAGVDIREVTSFPGVGPARKVAVAIKGGATVVPLDNVGGGLGGGDVLQFGATSFEFAVVDSVDGPASTVTLRYRLTRSYAKDAPVQKVTPNAGAGLVTTTRSIDAGDGLLILAGPFSATAIEIDDPPASEYHEVNAVADGGGFYAADGIVGVSTLTLIASAVPFQPLDRDLTIDSSRPVAALSFRLKT